MTATVPTEPAPRAESDESGSMLGELRRDRPFLWWVGGAMLVGLIFRVLWVLWVAREPTWQFFDNYRYLDYARRLAAGDGTSRP